MQHIHIIHVLRYQQVVSISVCCDNPTMSPHGTKATNRADYTLNYNISIDG